jgi:hypothetical protein
MPPTVSKLKWEFNGLDWFEAAITDDHPPKFKQIPEFTAELSPEDGYNIEASVRSMISSFPNLQSLQLNSGSRTFNQHLTLLTMNRSNFPTMFLPSLLDKNLAPTLQKIHLMSYALTMSDIASMVKLAANLWISICLKTMVFVWNMYNAAIGFIATDSTVAMVEQFVHIF